MIFRARTYKGVSVRDWFHNEYQRFLTSESKFTGHAWTYDYIMSLGEFNASDIVLDIGGGLSYLMPLISDYVSMGYILDKGIYDGVVNLGFEDWYSAYFKLENFRNGRFTVIRTEAKSLPFKDNYFDKIVSVSTFEHIGAYDLDADILASQEAFRCLKSGGLFMGTVDMCLDTEKPYGENEPSVYSYDSFYKRIVKSSNWELVGDIMTEEIEPQVSTNPYYKIDQLFFFLRKPKGN